MTPQLILVIEDDPLMLATTVRILGRFDYAVLAASDLEQGRALLEEHQDSVVAVVSDTNLPDGNAPALHAACEDILARNQIGWLGLTGDPTRNSAAATYYRTKGVEMLTKPFGMNELIGALRRVIVKG